MNKVVGGGVAMWCANCQHRKVFTREDMIPEDSRTLGEESRVLRLRVPPCPSCDGGTWLLNPPGSDGVTMGGRA